MSRHTVEESAVRDLSLDREDRTCRECGRRMHVRCRRSRSILTLEGPLRLSVGLVQCCDERCEHMTLYGPEQESGYAMPRWGNRLGCLLLDRSATVFTALVRASDSQ